MLPLYLACVVVGSWWMVRRLLFRTLFVIAAFAFLQNAILPMLYTGGFASIDLSKALLYFKEVLLLMLFAYACWRLIGRHAAVPNALWILMAFAGWCGLRATVGIIQGDDFGNALRTVRSLFMPLEFFTIGVAAVYEGDVAKRFFRWLVPVSAALALIAVFLFAAVGTDFWVKYANIASYNIELKGEDAADQIEDSGVSATGGGRPEFEFISQLRAFGTYGDPIALGFALSFVVLLTMVMLPPIKHRYLYVTPMMLAVFASLTRSAWIFASLAALVILVRRRKFLLISALVVLVVVTLVAVPPVT